MFIRLTETDKSSRYTTTLINVNKITHMRPYISPTVTSIYLEGRDSPINVQESEAEICAMIDKLKPSQPIATKSIEIEID